MGPRPEPRVAAFLDSFADEDIRLVCITVWEILDGIGRVVPGRRRDGLSERFLDFLDELFEDRIIGWSPDDDQACARIMENKRRRGAGRPRAGCLPRRGAGTLIVCLDETISRDDVRNRNE